MTVSDLRLILENKSTEELEDLLTLDYPEPNIEYIMTILEVLHERAEETDEDRAEVSEAWHQFQKSIHNN